MTAPSEQTPLHLDSLVVSGFRGIPHLEIPRLGRVTLLAGQNGVGKTAALEAVRVYAARGRYDVLAAVLESHAELQRATSFEGYAAQLPDWHGLFHGRDLWAEPGIRIGPCDVNRQLTMKTVWVDAAPTDAPAIPQFPRSEILALAVMYQGQHWKVPLGYRELNLPGRRFQPESEIPPAIGCHLLGPGLPDDLKLARLWDDAVITGQQSFVADALNLILDAPVEWIAVVGDTAPNGASGRRVMVQIAGAAAPVPLQSLGDGATRLFGVALALVNSRNGLLLVDEVDNGIHHTLQQRFWKLTLRAAEQFQVQVLATTHSWDCVVGFARAMQDLEYADGVYMRLEKHNHKMRAVVYPNDSLMSAAKYGIETR